MPAITNAMVEAALTEGGFSPANIHPNWGDVNGVVEMFNNAIALQPSAFTDLASRAALVGQCCQETGGFQFAEEINGYEARYAPYYGRGFIQLTWQSNYQAFGDWLRSIGKISNGYMFVGNPGLVASKEWAAVAAVYFFTQVRSHEKNCCQWAVTCHELTPGKWTEVSRLINAGNALTTYYGSSYPLRDRLCNAAYDAGTDATPPDTTDPSPLDLNAGRIKAIAAHGDMLEFTLANNKRVYAMPLPNMRWLPPKELAMDGETTPGTPGTPPPPPTGGSEAAARAVQWMRDHENQYSYTNSHLRDNQLVTGAGDCSSTVSFALVESGVCGWADLGVPGPPTWVGWTESLKLHGTLINTTCRVEDGPMLPGDLIIIDYQSDGVTDHVEMYTGPGETWGHGGGRDGTRPGPHKNDLIYWQSLNGASFQVRRYG